MPPKSLGAMKQASINSFFSPSQKRPAAAVLPKEPQNAPSSPPQRRVAATPASPSKPLYKRRKPEPAKPKAPVSPAESPLTSPAPAKPKPAKKAAKLTPLEQQFKDLKAANTDKVLAIQVGYKYKFFGHDAVVAAHLLNIMLIPGNLELHERTHDRYAYCLIPDVRLHIHLQRLLNHGLKVGVVKQAETAAIRSVESTNKSSVFLREVTAVYTKATYMGDEAVGSRTETSDAAETERYILCIDELGPKTAIVAVQPATGDILYDVFADTLARDELETRLTYLNPSEVIVIGAGDAVSAEVKTAVKIQNPAVCIEYVPQKSLESVQADLSDFFSEIDSNGASAHLAEYYVLNFLAQVQSCVNELIKYLAQFKLSNVFTITSNISCFSDSGRFMVLPATTLKALDIFQVEDDPSARTGTLLWLLNRTHTRKGASVMRLWIGKPLVDKDQIQARLDAVETLALESFVHMLDVFKSTLVKIGKSGVDLDKLLIRIHYSATYNSDKITRKELYLMLRNFADVLALFRDFGQKGIEEFKAKFPEEKLFLSILQTLLDASTATVVDTLLSQINSGAALSNRDPVEQKANFFNHALNSNFEKITTEVKEIEAIEAQLEDELKELKKYLKRPQLLYVTIIKDTHLIEVRNGKMVDSLPSDWLRINGTKSVSRFRPPAVSKLHKLLQYHNDKLIQSCDECFNSFLKDVDSHYDYLRVIVNSLAQYDCLLSLSSLASEGRSKYVKPVLTEKQAISIKLGSHPILLAISKNSGFYVPNDVDINYDENRVLIITGPNMGGKSSLVKQIALFAIMTQVGCFLPCSEAQMGIFDSIHIRMGASDNILKGKSTFMVEMLECSNIIKSYSLKSLIILDEIGRGTGTCDGISLAYSILKYIIEDPQGPLTLFITHYPSLHVLEQEHSTVQNHHMAFIEKNDLDGKEGEWPEVIFLYKLVRGVVSNLYGLNVAKLAGIDKPIIDAAYRISEAMKNLIEQQEALSALSDLSADNVMDKLLTVCKYM